MEDPLMEPIECCPYLYVTNCDTNNNHKHMRCRNMVLEHHRDNSYLDKVLVRAICMREFGRCTRHKPHSAGNYDLGG